MSPVRQAGAVLALVPFLLAFADRPAVPGGPAPVIKVADKRKLQLCLALRGCRSAYTRCYNRIEKKFPPQQWNLEREKCVAPYKACIDKHFKGGELWFTRWFVPDENCEQYR